MGTAGSAGQEGRIRNWWHSRSGWPRRSHQKRHGKSIRLAKKVASETDGTAGPAGQEVLIAIRIYKFSFWKYKKKTSLKITIHFPCSFYHTFLLVFCIINYSNFNTFEHVFVQSWLSSDFPLAKWEMDFCKWEIRPETISFRWKKLPYLTLPLNYPFK